MFLVSCVNDYPQITQIKQIKDQAHWTTRVGTPMKDVLISLAVYL